MKLGAYQFPVTKNIKYNFETVKKAIVKASHEGVRILVFPEFFRELYEECTDLNIIMFYDVADYDDTERYELIKSHIRTRAVENVTYTLAVDTICPYQTAPTALYDRSGGSLIELKRNEESMLVYDLEKTEPNFGEKARIEISNWLMKF